ncbi:MAG: OsmC family protein [bacterium]
MTEPQSATGENVTDADGGRWVSTKVGATGYRASVTARTHNFVIDEPTALGGGDEGPTPYEYLLGSLSGCTAMTLRLYANRKKWPLESVEVRMRTSRSHEIDCENCEKTAVGIQHIERKIELNGPLSDEQKQRLMEIADRCPVKQTLERGIKVDNAR